MKFFCSCESRCLMRMLLILLAVLLLEPMMLGQTATTTTLGVLPSSSSTSPLAPKTMVTLTATVTVGSTHVTPGLVKFCDATAPHCLGTAVVGTAQLTSNGTATLRFIAGDGSHSYSAVFAGTATYTTSISMPQTVTALQPTTTSIASSGNKGNYTLTATVVGIGNAVAGPTGNVDFIDTTDLNRSLETATLGSATLAQSFVNAKGSPVAVGINPNNAAVGDFNGDGIPDLAVPNPGSNNVSILLGDGEGGFAPGSPVAVGNTPLGVDVGDFNGDGIADIAVANFDPNTLSILLGNGDGTFREATGSPISVGTNPDFVAVGDFNNDGIADVAVTNSGDTTVSILLGNGSGGFTEVLPRLAVGSLPRGVAVGDFNGDGIADLEIANQGSNSVSILLGHGDGTFNTSQVAVGASPFGVAVGYFNSDGFADLAVTNFNDNTVSILLGDGHGTFTQATGSPLAVGNVPRNVSVGDFNGDGIADLAVTDSNDNNVRILLGNGTGSFTQASWSPVAVGDRPYGVSVGDFNGDGIADLAVANLVPNTVSILLNQVTQTSTAMVTGVSIPGSGMTHNVTATYAGDTNFDGSTSSAIPLTTSPVTTTTLLELSTAGTIAFGTPVTLIANVMPYSVNGMIATGTMSFLNGGTLVGTVPISNTGEASTTVSTFTIATHALTAMYNPGDTNFVTSTSAAVSLIVNAAPIAVSLTSSDNPSGYGQTVTFTATVPSGATGTIQFRDGSADLGGPVALTGGVAAYAASALTAGIHSITAAYSGDSTHAAATSDVLLQLVTPAILTVTANNVRRTFNQPNGAFNYTITGLIGDDFVRGTPTLVTTATEVSPVGTYPIIIGMGSLSSPNYSFTFVNGTLTVVPATLTVTANNASRTFGAANPVFTGTVTGAVHGDTFIFSASTTATASSPVGTYPITPSVTGSSLTNYTVQTVSGTLTVTRATLTVAAHNAFRVFGQPNPLFAVTISGFVNSDTSAVISGAPALSTTATTDSPVGTYPITVTQGTLFATNYGFAFFDGILTVDFVILTPPEGPSEQGAPVTLTATVPAGATGTVTFYDGTTVLGIVTIPDTLGRTTGTTTVTLVTTSLPPGTQTITAVFSGDANFPPSTSPSITVVITPPPPDFTVASSTGRQLIPPGASANFIIAVSSMNEPFTNPVTMSASGLPPGATYTFNPAAVTPGTTGANTTFTVSVPPQSSMASRSRRLGPAAFALLLLPFVCMKRYRSGPQRLLVWMFMTLLSFGAISGCGEGGYFSQTEQTYTITVTGTNGNLVRTATVTLTVE